MADDARAGTPTPEQEAAAASDARHTLVIAGPGAGKTATLVRRVEHLLRGGAEPSSVLVLAFTRAAAGELRQRMPPTLPRDSVRTLHSLAARLISADPAAFGLSAGFSVLDKGNSARVLEALRTVTFGHSGRWSYPVPAAELLVRADERMLGPIQYAPTCRDLDAAHIELLCGVAEEFERITAAAGEVALSRLVPLAVKRMTADPAYRAEVAGRLTHVLVDEFQDLDPSQLAFLDRLLSRGAALWAVGDEDQCLYEYRSADTRHMADFATDHPGAAVHFLTGNHRCARAVVDAAANLISHNRARSAKPRQVALRDEQGSVSRRSFEDTLAEAQWVVGFVAEHLDAGRTVAVLGRSLRRLEAVEGALNDGEVAGVDVMTVHTAKGRQWDVVVVVGFEEGAMPDHRAKDDGLGEEERRIAYVALTRARSAAVLSRVRKDRWEREPSRFLRETVSERPSPAPRGGVPPVGEPDPDAIRAGDTVHILVDGRTRNTVIVGQRPGNPLHRRLLGAFEGDDFVLPNDAHVKVEAVVRPSPGQEEGHPLT